MIYMRRQVFRVLQQEKEIWKSWKARQVCVCEIYIDLRAQVRDSLRFLYIIAHSRYTLNARP